MTTILTQMTATQESKFSTFNDNLSSVSPAAFMGRRPIAITVLTWAYFGGKIWANGGWRTIANNTITCIVSSTNYIGLDLEGDGTDPAITINQSGFVDGEIPIVEVVCDGTDITSETDRRRAMAFDPQGSDVQVIAFTATVTPDTLKGRIVDVGAITEDATIAAPLNPFLGAELDFMFLQDGTGGWSITWDGVFKKASDPADGTLDQVMSTSFIYNGTNWIQRVGAFAWFS